MTIMEVSLFAAEMAGKFIGIFLPLAISVHTFHPSGGKPSNHRANSLYTNDCVLTAIRPLTTAQAGLPGRRKRLSPEVIHYPIR
jgi:hypothetical protein